MAKAYWEWVLTDDDGRILRSMMTRENMPWPWRRLSRDEADQVLGRPDHWLVFEDGIKRRREIRFLVSTERFRAGESFSVNVRDGEHRLGENEPVQFRLNGEVHTVTKRDHVNVRANEPGEFEVVLDDPRYCADKTRWIVVVLPAEE